jgi:GlcNAc-P-P-Und epimerase
MESTLQANRKVLITGGSGFIGTNLVDCLEGLNNTEILNLDKAPPRKRTQDVYWKKVDIMDEENVRQVVGDFRPLHVIHLAARTDLDEKKSLEGYEENIVGTENVLKAVNETDSVQRVIVTSSMLVNSVGKNVSSDEDYSPSNLYGQSKVLTETITRQFGTGCEWIIVRPTTIWGPWNFTHVNGFFRILRKGLYFHPGRKPILKSYGYVGNVVHQIVRLLEAPGDGIHHKTFYVGDPPIDLRLWVDEFSRTLRGKKVRTVPISFLRLIATFGDMLETFGVRFPLTSFRLANMTLDNTVNIQETLAITGPSPYSLQVGVRETINWLQGYESEQ